jgi:translation initiation factor 1
MTDADLALNTGGGFGEPSSRLARSGGSAGAAADAPAPADAFADAAQQEDSANEGDYVHIRIQQRNGKKSLTTVQVRSGRGRQ